VVVAGALCGPARRQERRQVDEANAAGQARQDVREVLARIDASETARAEDCVGDRGALTASVGAREEKILAIMRSSA
jgi:hypothetical protein